MAHGVAGLVEHSKDIGEVHLRRRLSVVIPQGFTNLVAAAQQGIVEAADLCAAFARGGLSNRGAPGLLFVVKAIDIGKRRGVGKTWLDRHSPDSKGNRSRRYW